jgi:hypothetical protein
MAVWIYAIDHNIPIEREPCSFTYIFNNKEHLYYPDFRYNGELIEIKGDMFFDKNDNIIDPYKRDNSQLIEKYKCMLNHNVIIWRRNQVYDKIKYVKQTYGKKFFHEHIYDGVNELRHIPSFILQGKNIKS